MFAPMQFDSLIFDLDGTLWNTAELCARAWNLALKARNIDDMMFTETDLGNLMGLNAEEIRRKVFPKFSPEDGARLLQECFNEEIAHLNREPANFYPGVFDGIRQLAERYPLFLVSNCDESYLAAFFKSSGLSHAFRDSECYGRTKKAKGENIRSVVERNGLIAPCYVGDTEGDRRGAELAQIPFLFVSYGFGRVESFFESFPNFPSLVDRLTRA